MIRQQIDGHINKRFESTTIHFGTQPKALEDPVPTLPYGPNEAFLQAKNEGERLLLAATAIESHGCPDIRTARKAAVDVIQNYLVALDMIPAEQWRARLSANLGESHSPKVVVPCAPIFLICEASTKWFKSNVLPEVSQSAQNCAASTHNTHGCRRPASSFWSFTAWMQLPSGRHQSHYLQRQCCIFAILRKPSPRRPSFFPRHIPMAHRHTHCTRRTWLRPSSGPLCVLSKMPLHIQTAVRI
jgi:hypothetical protein